MNIDALSRVIDRMDSCPERVNNAINKLDNKEGLEEIFVDMMIDEIDYEANIKVMKSELEITDYLINKLV